MKIALFGAGMMGEALLSGLIQAEWDPAGICVVEARAERQAEIADRYKVTTGTAAQAVDGAAAVIVAVKPYDVPSLLNQLSPSLPLDCVVISMAAGLTVATLERHLPDKHPLVRVMPNTGALVREAMTVMCPGTGATPEHMATARRVLSAVGQVEVIPEKQMDVVTAVSGSGPAYVMYVAESMIDAGVMLGLPRPLAMQLVRQTLYGSAKLLATSDQHPTVLKEMVVSPGGTTSAALRTFEEHGVKAAFIDAIEAAFKRSQEMG